MLTELRRAPPGGRFRQCYRTWRARRRESSLASALYMSAGVLSLGVGVVFAFSPVVPGFVFVLAGLVLLSTRSAWVAHRLDRMELACRRWLPRRWRPGAQRRAAQAVQCEEPSAGAEPDRRVRARGARSRS
ncbi:MAG TPA: hypothetical protein VF203_01475 [Burkholderiales bacterium]